MMPNSEEQEEIPFIPAYDLLHPETGLSEAEAVAVACALYAVLPNEKDDESIGAWQLQARLDAMSQQLP